MKKSTILLSFLFLIFFQIKSNESSVINQTNFYINDYPYQRQATNWVRNYILDYNGDLLVYSKEIQLIANLIYFSFKRSYITLQAQEIALQSLDTIWKGWQNIARTRLDPSIDDNYQHIPEYEKNSPVAHFWRLHDQHRLIGKTYAQAVEYIVNGDILLTINAQNSVKNMRDQARTVVAQSIVDVKNYIGTLFYAEKKSQKGFGQRSLAFLDYLYSYIPNLALNSFVEACKTNDMVSQDGWEILFKIQQVGAHTWKMIEQERASIYLAFYKAIWQAIKSLDLDDEYLKIHFDQNGPIPIDHQHDYLPDPQSLIQNQYTR